MIRRRLPLHKWCGNVSADYTLQVFREGSWRVLASAFALALSMSEALLTENVRQLRVTSPDLGAMPHLASLHEQQPDLVAGSKEVCEALTALNEESSMASVKCCVCSDALSHDQSGVRCTSDPPHHLCGDCSISFCSSKLNELSADAFPPACSMCSEPVTLASFDAHVLSSGHASCKCRSLTLSQQSASRPRPSCAVRTARTLRPARMRST